MNSSQISILFVVYFFTALAVPLTALRCYTRFRILGSFGIDDCLAIFSILFHVAAMAVILRGVYHGIGVHIRDIDLSTMVDGVMVQSRNAI